MKKRPTADYGQDAPGVRRGMFAAALTGLILMGGATLLLSAGWIKLICITAGLLAAAYGLFMGLYMTRASRIGKLRTRDFLLDEAATILKWNGHEKVLDVGCGRGLLLIGAAHRLVNGVATGIDIWSNEDQSGNSPAATLENARRENVFEKVRVETGDARRLPFGDQSMDLVMSHWVVHNLKHEADRISVLDEMWRVTRDGGVIALADIEHVSAYKNYFVKRGARGVTFNTGGAAALVMGVLSGGSYRPQTLIVTR